MKRPLRKILVLLLGLALVFTQVGAGEIIVYEFKPGTESAREVLAHVRIKGLVAEFLDPADTGLGKSLGYLLWREVLTAISDQAGAGVILARPRRTERLTDLLKRDYHQAGVQIAEQQKARMLLWGAVNVAEDKLYLSSYLTLIPELIGADLALNLNIEGTGFSAANPRTRFNFAPVTTSRDGLFRRTIITRTDLRPRRRPTRNAPGTAVIPKDTALQALDMHGPWFKVRLPGGSWGYVNQSQVAVPPLSITADERVNVRTSPGGRNKQSPITAGQNFDVLDMRYREGSGTWYRIERNGVSGWVASWVVRPRYSIPAVLFMAGLYRYQSGNYPEAVRSFERFLKSTGTWESNVNLAAAHQMLGAAQLADRRFEDKGSFDARTYLAPFDKAVALTPHDPAAYRLRILGHLANWSMPAAIGDLQRSLELDRFNPEYYQLLDDLAHTLSTDNPRHQVLHIYDFFQEQDVERIDRLNRKYDPARRLLNRLSSLEVDSRRTPPPEDEADLDRKPPHRTSPTFY